MKKIIKYWFKFCCEHPSNIEGYDRWLNDTTDTKYHCHHRLEIELGKTSQELIAENLYYNRPASELIIFTETEHHSLHSRNMSEETKRKISDAKKNISEETRRKLSEATKNMSDETRRKLSEATKGSNNGMYGKHHSEETRRKLSEATSKQMKGLKYWNNGVINKRSKTCPGPDFIPGQLRHK